MSYVNNTGKNIGQCLTGFGISYPVTIYNNGNYPVSYSVTNTNSTVFTVSSNNFSLDPDDSKTLNINYIPAITASEAQDTFSLQVSGTSQENNTVDPSGAITINLTGQRKINITGGNVRSLHNYVIREKNETSYTRNGFFDFYWLSPSGLTGQNLNNYFITGYVLEIANNTSFTSASGYSIGIQKNTSETPRFSTVNGFGDILLNYKIADSFEIEDSSGSGRNYYARMYTLSNGNTGASVYSTGILPGDFLNEQVINGNTTTIPNINNYPKVLTLNIEGVYTDFDLYSKILEKAGENDFSLYTGIQVYFKDNSTFTSSSRTKFPLSLEGVLNNYAGSVAGKVIDFYFGENVTFQAKHGDNQIPTGTNDSDVGPDANSGGDVFNIKPSSKIDGTTYTNFIINIYTRPSCSIYAGGGGNKAGWYLQGYSNRGPAIYVGRYSSSKVNFFGQDGIIGWTEVSTSISSYPQDSFSQDRPGVTIEQAQRTNRTKNNSAGKIFQKNSEAEIYLGMESYVLPSTPYFRFKSSDISGGSSWVSDASYASLTLTAPVGKEPSVDASLIYNGLKFSSADEMSISFSSTSVNVNDFDLFFVLAIEDVNPNNGLNHIFNWYNSANPDNICTKNFKTHFLYYNRTLITQTKTRFLSNEIDYPNFKTSNAEFYPNGSNNDEIIPINFSCFFTPLLNNRTANFYNDKYRRMIDSACQDFVSRNSYDTGSILYNSTTTDRKVPLFINISRRNKMYTVFVNGKSVASYDYAGNEFTLINNLQNTVFKLMSDTRSFTVFDILFYNRSLLNSEKITVNNFLAKEYFKLITGYDEFPYRLSRNRIKLPNLFNIAGRI